MSYTTFEFHGARARRGLRGPPIVSIVEQFSPGMHTALVEQAKENALKVVGGGETGWVDAPASSSSLVPKLVVALVGAGIGALAVKLLT